MDFESRRGLNEKKCILYIEKNVFCIFFSSSFLITPSFVYGVQR
jgi:hypothetical protein